MTIMPARTDAAHQVVTTPLLAAALDAAARGWSVLPCQPSGPRAKAPIGAAVPHGHLQASTDPATITAWWSRYPTALIGAAVPPSLLVIDVDPRNGGSRRALEEALGVLPATLRVISGRGDGGVHLYFRRPPGALVATAVPRGVDLKLAGYCLLPPSPHPATGRAYRWHLAAPAHLPSAAVAALRPPRAPAMPALPPRGGHQRGAALVRTVERAERGDRNGATFWAACRAIEGGHGEELVEQIAAAAVGTGLAEREVAATIASARRTATARR